MPDSNCENDPAPRITALEERLTYLEQQLEQLDGVVLGQRKEIDELSRELSRSRTAIEQLQQGGGEDLPYEKPPHY